MRHLSKLVFCSAAISLVVACDTGYQDVESAAPVSQQEQPEAQDEASPPGMNQRTGGRPSLGKARNTAENTLDKLQAHDRDIQREIDRQNQN